jgi:hypothetical protein
MEEREREYGSCDEEGEGEKLKLRDGEYCCYRREKEKDGGRCLCAQDGEGDDVEDKTNKGPLPV